MRLWHKDLITALPRQQLLSQWRECCAIARNIAVNGTPNHILVNKIMDYPMGHFYRYASEVSAEMRSRGYKCDPVKFNQWVVEPSEPCSHREMFAGWHNDRYLQQCFCNLEEKYDCGGISENEWLEVLKVYLCF